MSYLIIISIVFLGIVIIDKTHNAYCRRRDLVLKELRIKIETLKLMTKAEILHNLRVIFIDENPVLEPI